MVHHPMNRSIACLIFLRQKHYGEVMVKEASSPGLPAGATKNAGIPILISREIGVLNGLYAYHRRFTVEAQSRFLRFFRAGGEEDATGACFNGDHDGRGDCRRVEAALDGVVR